VSQFELSRTDTPSRSLTWKKCNNAISWPIDWQSPSDDLRIKLTHIYPDEVEKIYRFRVEAILSSVTVEAVLIGKSFEGL
jgi:hypothetical protein